MNVLLEDIVGRAGPYPGPGPPGSHGLGFSPDQVAAGREMRYVSLAMLSALLYDITLTYALEVKHVYKTRWSLVKALWFANRVGVPLTFLVHMINVSKSNPSHTFCNVTGSMTLWLSAVNLFVMQFTLCLRVMAIYQRSKVVNYFIGFLLFGSTLSRVLIFALKPVPHPPSPNQPVLPGCLELPDKTLAGAYWAPLVLDTVLFVMTVVRVGSGIPDRAALSHAPLIVLIFRDGALYFGLVVVAIAITTAGYYSIPLLGPCTSSYLFLGIVSIACSRLLLHLRDATSPHSVISLSGRDVVFNKSEPLVFNHSEAVTTDEPDTTCASADIEEA